VNREATITATALAAVGIAALLLETGLTRLLSFKLAHNQAVLLVAAIWLGAAVGARLVACGGATPGPTLRAALGVLGALAAALGTLVVCSWELETGEPLREAWVGLRLAGLLSPFAVAAASLGALVVAGLSLPPGPTPLDRVRRAGRSAGPAAALLLGMSAGALLATPLLGAVGAPRALLCAGALLGLAGALLAWRHAAAGAAAIAALGLAAVALLPGLLPDPVPDASIKHLPAAGRRVVSGWGPTARLDVIEHAPSRPRLVYLDASLSTSLPPAEAALADLEALTGGAGALAYRLAPQPVQRVAVLGAGGGREVVRALLEGAGAVLAVEEDAALVALLERVLAENAAQLPSAAVTLHRQGVRAFVAEQTGSFDVIELAAPRSRVAASAALASAAVEPESRLLTAEGLASMLRRLSQHGVLSLRVGELDWETPLLTLRLLATVREAYRQLGVSDPQRYIAVVTTPGFGQLVTLLFSRTPVPDDALERLLEAVRAIPGAALRFAAGRVFDRGLPIELLLQPDRALDRWLAAQPWRLRPVSDDSPFPWHWRPWSEIWVASEGGDVDIHDGRRERLLLGLLLASLALAAALIGLPLPRRATGQRPRAGLLLLGAAAGLCQAGLAAGLVLVLGGAASILGVLLPIFFAWASVGCLASSRLRSALASRVSPRWPAVRLLLAAAPLAGLILVRLCAPALLGLASASALLAWGVAWLALAPFGFCIGALLAWALEDAAERAGGAAGVAAACGCLAASFVAGALLACVLAMEWGFGSVLAAGASALSAAVLAATRPGALRPEAFTAVSVE